MTDPTSPDYGLLDRAGLGNVIFYPRRDSRPPPQGARDLFVEVGPETSLGLRFYTFDPAAPTILYFHGNGEVAADHDDIAGLYHQIGRNLLVADFRGYGRSGGSPSFAALVGDAHPVAEHFHALLNAEGYSATRFIMGRSLGSHPALELAANGHGFGGLILESGAANLRRMLQRLGGGTASGPAAGLLDAHQRKLDSIRLPTLIIHGELDELIPVEHAIELHDGLLAERKELVIIPGAGHNDILWVGLRDYFGAIAAFTGG